MKTSQITIKMQSVEDAAEQFKVMPELNSKNSETGEHLTVCIMEDMTVNHKAGISFVIHKTDGTYTVANITENLMNGLISAYKGALQRFEDLKGN